MTGDQFKNLQRGDIVRNLVGGDSYVVEDTLDHRQIIAVRTIVLTNPVEWVKITKPSERRRLGAPELEERHPRDPLNTSIRHPDGLRTGTRRGAT